MSSSTTSAATIASLAATGCIAARSIRSGWTSATCATTASQTGPFNAVQGTFSINRQEDDRLEQTLPSALRDTEQARVTAFGYQGQATTLVARKHAVTFGGELYDEYIDTARVQFLDNPSRQVTLRPEIPDGTRYTSTSVFVQDSTEVLAGRVSLRGGLRYGNFSFRTKAQPAFNVKDEEVSSDAVTFNAGAVVALHDNLNATVSVNRGFRAANAFDLGALGVTGGGYELSPTTAIELGALAGTSDGADATSTGVAVAALKPESMYAYEAGLEVPQLEAVGVAQRVRSRAARSDPAAHGDSAGAAQRDPRESARRGVLRRQRDRSGCAGPCVRRRRAESGDHARQYRSRARPRRRNGCARTHHARAGSPARTSRCPTDASCPAKRSCAACRRRWAASR